MNDTQLSKPSISFHPLHPPPKPTLEQVQEGLRLLNVRLSPQVRWHLNGGDQHPEFGRLHIED